MSYLELTGFYRSLMKAYAKQEGPLWDLLLKVPLNNSYSKTAYHKAMTDFQLDQHLTTEHTNTFLDLQAAITARPVLQAPRYDGSIFIVTSDRCIEGFAVVLSQWVKV